MTNAALRLESSNVAAPACRAEVLPNYPNHRISREMLVLGAIMIVVQILDGLLTAIGVQHFGTAIEGNPIIRTLMETFGAMPALIAVKSFAVMVVIGLCALSSVVNWISPTLKTIVALYVFGAIIPWLTIIYQHIL